MPSSNGHLVHGLGLLLPAELLRVIDDGVITTSDVGAESLLGRLRNHAELVLSEQLVAVSIAKRNTLGLDGLEAGELVNKDILAMGADNIVLEGSVVGRLSSNKHGRQALGMLRRRDEVGEADCLSVGSNGLFRLGMRLKLELDLGASRGILLSFLSNSVQATLVFRGIVLHAAEVGSLGTEPELSTVKVCESFCCLRA